MMVERGFDVGIRDEVRALVESLDEPGTDAVLHAEHLHGGEQLLLPFGERDDVAGGEELIGQLEDGLCSANQRPRAPGTVRSRNGGRGQWIVTPPGREKG